MGPVTHQTIRLSRGSHTSKDKGACVMELASMLAGEPFSDHPDSVCPVIGALLRAYNDWIDDARRQNLYVYAAKVVGSRESSDLERMRAERVSAWITESPRRRRLRSFVSASRRVAPSAPVDVLAAAAIRALRTRDNGASGQVLELVDELLALGSPERPRPVDNVPQHVRQAPVGC